ncbi:uncharacterized protein LOC127279164 isoform X2 [Leptopilina boulardi]|uniref:uncharacterized protein LOC127279164 isoform X2 n=1 Tax=Leptopilina boulardi TaxID=63433 RepID=UPI0021F52664|nr:uncharacterized protein LOC127279164 isoform X2 [Leptopilina boulardi]
MEDFNDGIEGQQASRLRTANPEQFFTLVKMHLSFELDRNTEDNDCVMEKAKLKKWGLISFSKKSKSSLNLHKGPEGVPLTQEGIKQVKRLINYLSQEECILQEGIFRRTGKLTRQQDLKNALHQGLSLDFEEGRFSVHDCASVLKNFLADLPEPLLTDSHYPVHCQIAELCSPETSANDARLLRSLQLLLLLLPPINRVLLKHLLNLLNKTASFENSNKMNCDTLATLFTPHLMCPRKLSPEALHINSQNLSVIVAFMIKKGLELFEIPPKLAMDVRAYWVDQERKLLSPKKSDLNESMSDTTGTAHTVFSFVDHQLTAQATASQDTQAALAQLYAYIQSMPESAKKRKLVKQFNKENGQGTPRHVKNVRTKSLGDSIKKHIFQKKLLGHKKLLDLKLGCNFSRSSSEENMLSVPLDKPRLPPKGTLSKSEDELSSDSFNILETDNLLKIKHMSSSTGSLHTPILSMFKAEKARLINFLSIDEEHSRTENYSETNLSEIEEHLNSHRISGNEKANSKISKHVRLSRHCSEPPNMYSSQASLDDLSENENFVRQNSDPTIATSKRTNMDALFTPKISISNIGSRYSTSDKDSRKSEGTSSATGVKYASPMKSILRNMFTAHTSTPSNFLHRNLTANEYILTPITDNDKSMSPITQSATKMSKTMQENIMTPRSRKPVMMLSTTSICNFPALQRDSIPSSSYLRGFNGDLEFRNDCASIMEESPDTYSENIIVDNKENVQEDVKNNQNLIFSTADEISSAQKSSSITSTFREYLLSRSVLDASPVDLSFTSRTGDFEPSESDINILNEDTLSDSLLHCLDGNNPGSDTSGIASGSTNSADNSSEIMDEVLSPRKRGTSLQRNDSKRTIKDKVTLSNSKNQSLMHKHVSDSNLSSLRMNEAVNETAF